MKYDPYLLSRWCDAALHGRNKWFTLSGSVLALLLALLIPCLRGLLLSLLCLYGAMLLLYVTHRHHAFGASYQRTPRPREAQCETLLIDASLIGQGTRLRAATQPIDVGESLTLRLGSGALMLGTVMTVTADQFPPADRTALLSAVQSLNINPGRVCKHNPVLHEEKLGTLTILTIQDGMNRRRCYVGTPEDVAPLCRRIWEKNPRELTDHDLFRIRDTARYIAQGGCRVMAFATALEKEEPIFLGMAGLGEELHFTAVKDVEELRAMGLTLMLDSADYADTDVDSLRAMLDLPEYRARADIHLTPRRVPGYKPLKITRQPGDSLVEPIRQLRERFRIIEDTLRRVGMELGLALLASLMPGAAFLPVLTALWLTCGAVFIGVDLSAPRLRWPTLALSAALLALCGLFLHTQEPPLAAFAGCLPAIAVSLAGLLRLCGKGYSLRGGDGWSIGLTAVAGLSLLALILLCLLQGMSCLPALTFSLLMSLACALLILFGHMLFS